MLHSLAPSNLNHLVLDVFCQPFFQGLRNHGQLVPEWRWNTTKNVIFCDQGFFGKDSTHFLLGVSAKHLSDEVSTTVSQKATTGSATLMSGGGREIESPKSWTMYEYVYYKINYIHVYTFSESYIHFENPLYIFRILYTF